MPALRTADTPTLRSIVERGNKVGFNRQIQVGDFDLMADEKGTHVLEKLMLHEHIAGQLVTPHVRALVLIKCKEKDEPSMAFLDMSQDDWLSLERVLDDETEDETD